MIQFVFISLFVVTIIAGLFSYFSPLQRTSRSPVQFVMDENGYSDQELSSRKKTQLIVMTTQNGLVQMRRNIDNIALEQNKIFDSLHDRQETLKNSGRMASDIMLAIQDQRDKSDRDMLRLRDLASRMKDQQEILVNHGQELLALNDRIAQNRQAIQEQLEEERMNTQSSFNALKDRYDDLKRQEMDYFHRVTDYNHDVVDKIKEMQDKMHEVLDNAHYNNALQQQNIKDRVQAMLDKERENMQRLADSEEKNREILQEAQQKQEDAQQQINDKLQQDKDASDDEHQKAEDQQEILKQRIADQMQQIQDQQDQRNH